MLLVSRKSSRHDLTRPISSPFYNLHIDPPSSPQARHLDRNLSSLFTMSAAPVNYEMPIHDASAYPEHTNGSAASITSPAANGNGVANGNLQESLINCKVSKVHAQCPAMAYLTDLYGDGANVNSPVVNARHDLISQFLLPKHRQHNKPPPHKQLLPNTSIQQLQSPPWTQSPTTP